MQGRLYRSARLWAFYCDLEESLGTLESTRAVYDRILDLRIATPQIILNYAAFLQARLYMERSWARKRRCSSYIGAQQHRFYWPGNADLFGGARGFGCCLKHAGAGAQEHKYWEEAFRVYERGVALFRYPHVKDIWAAYLAHFVARYKGTKLERARDLFRQALGQARAAATRPCT